MKGLADGEVAHGGCTVAGADPPAPAQHPHNTRPNSQGTLMNIGDVAGPNARPSWKFFYDQTGASEPTWNFKGKFLVDRNGKVSVPSSNVEADIVALLDQQPEL